MIKTGLEEVKGRPDYVEHKDNMPSELLLRKIFSDNESFCKVRKKNDVGWANLDSMKRPMTSEQSGNHQRATVEENQPRGKGFPFLKVSFTTQSKRWTFTKASSTTKGTHGYIISPMEPSEVSGWLPG